MTRIRRIRLILPARMARSAPQAAREIAERLVDTAHDAGFEPSGRSVTIHDTGQNPSQIGLIAGRSLSSRKTGSMS